MVMMDRCCEGGRAARPWPRAAGNYELRDAAPTRHPPTHKHARLHPPTTNPQGEREVHDVLHEDRNREGVLPGDRVPGGNLAARAPPRLPAAFLRPRLRAARSRACGTPTLPHPHARTHPRSTRAHMRTRRRCSSRRLPACASWASTCRVRSDTRPAHALRGDAMSAAPCTPNHTRPRQTALPPHHIQPPHTLAPLTIETPGTFLRGVLDKVGVEPQVKRIGAYKSAGDQLLRKDM